MDATIESLLGRLEQLPEHFRELRDGVRQVVKIADASPEMALTRARKVLEYVVRDVYERRVNEPPGTRPLENLLQRLVKDGFFPERLDAYANTVRKLGNVGTHSFGESVALADVYQSLAQLMPILEWYFEVERPEAGAKHSEVRQAVDPQSIRVVQNKILRRDAAHTASVAIVPKGLRSFDAYDADFFLELLPGARDKDGLPQCIRFWKHRIEADGGESFTVGIIYGPSGCGKSSLVKAGLLPQLSSRIEPVYVEATADETEIRLLKGLHKRRPELDEGLTLVDAIHALRSSAQESKVLLVVDQFEQWLHAHCDKQDTELARALRQCDCRRVQCVLLVRDDFWMALSRFMDDLQIELLQGQNMAAVDLFDPIHARNVLAAFGRALGRVETPAIAEQERFLDQAIRGLAQDGRVISVRLALIAEMVKGRPWVPATLDEVGGTEGIGVSFLEESFSTAGASREHRYHEKGAQGVLAALLPESGSDIKGHMRSHAELLEASGYKGDAKRFDDLVRILDSELRLITPTHPEERAAADSPTTPQKYYQLTHDYLVPSLREWLTRKQKGTRRGRAELRLADRAAMWNARPENRQLPSLFQWINIRALTKAKHWTPPQRKMMQRADRYHRLRVLIATAMLVVGLIAARELFGRIEAKSLVDQLVSADISQVPGIVQKIDRYRRWTDALLKDVKSRTTEGSAPQLHLELALLPVDKNEVAELRERLLKATPAQFSVVRDALLPYQQEVVEPLWQAALDGKRTNEECFQAACALATFAPTDERWRKVQTLVVANLVTRHDAELMAWLEALRPARQQLYLGLELVYRSKAGQEQPRTYAGLILADYLAEEPQNLFNLLADAAPFQFPVMFRASAKYKDQLIAWGQHELALKAAQGASEEEKERLAQRQANVAAALYQFGDYDAVWPLLVHLADPRLRSYVIHRIQELGGKPQPLAERLDAETDVSIRRALVLALGEFPLVVDDALAAKLQQIYESADDPGLHAAAEWLLRQAQQDLFLTIAQKRDASKEQRDRRTAGILQKLKTEKSRQWLVTSEAQTMVAIPGPVEFIMGSPESEAGRFDDEPQHRVRIGRSFAIGSTPVTVEEYRRFNPKYEFTQRFAPNPTCPAINVSWYEAAAYCNWLSKQDGIEPSQWCYETSADGKVVKLKEKYLGLKGYRLPTEAEAEYATRAGTTSSRFYGESEELLPEYGWYVKNSDDHSWPVGTTKPNDFGLFDTLGNVWCWCQDNYMDYPTAKDGTAAGDVEDGLRIDNQEKRVLRGAACDVTAAYLRCAARHDYLPTYHVNTAGFRVARTITSE